MTNMKTKVFWGPVLVLVLGFSWSAASQEAAPGAAEQAVAPQAPEASEPQLQGAPNPSELDLPTISPGEEITLAQALEAADKRNITLESARLELVKAQAQVKQAWALVLPGVEAGLKYTRMDHEDVVDFGDSLGDLGIDMPMEPMVVNPQDQLVGTIGAGMSLINAQNWFTITAAKRGTAVAEHSIEDARQQILLGVAMAYHYALQAKSYIAMLEEDAVSAAHHLKVAKARQAAGAGLKIDVIRAQTDLEQARQKLEAAHLSLDNARDALGLLTGLDGLPLPAGERNLSAPDGSEEDLAQQARESRSDLKAKDAMIGVMDAQLDAAWMQFLPTLDVGWQLQYTFTDMAALGSTDRSRWALVFTLTVPIYNHYRYGDLDYKRAALRQAILDEEDASKKLSSDVRKARRDYLSALNTLELAGRQLELAKEAMRLVESSYNAGTGTSLEVTDARKTLTAAGFNVINSRLNAQLALLELLRSIGQDMSNLPG